MLNDERKLVIDDSSITDISVVASMPLLELFGCHKDPGKARKALHQGPRDLSTRLLSLPKAEDAVG